MQRNEHGKATHIFTACLHGVLVACNLAEYRKRIDGRLFTSGPILPDLEIGGCLPAGDINEEVLHEEMSSDNLLEDLEVAVDLRGEV